MEINVSEKVIEDIFTIDKSILSEVIQLNYSDLSLLARQKNVSSGILDLLYLWKDQLILIELKAVPFYNEIIKQINGYYDDLVRLQQENKLIRAELKKYIFVTKATEANRKICIQNDVNLIVFDPKTVLSRYYENFKELSQFLNIQSGDFGMVRLGFLNTTLKYLGEGCDIEEIRKLENKSSKTIRNRLSVAIQLGLVGKFKKGFYLTELGEKFNATNDSVDDRLSENQKELLQNFVKENPFFSSITYTIFSIVESVFVLSKNSYPVPKNSLKDYFVKSVGKSSTWSADKSKETATYIFSNYAIELDLLAKVNNEFFITPNGIQAILLLQLNRSLKLIENKKI
jgi:hypothetical protein